MPVSEKDKDNVPVTGTAGNGVPRCAAPGGDVACPAPPVRTPASLRQRYVGSAFWSMAGIAASQSLNLLSAFIVARILGPAQYGELGIIMRTTAAFGTFAGIGLGTATTRYLAELRTTDPARAGRVWGLIDAVAVCTSAAASILVIVLAQVLAQRVLKAPHLAGLLCLSVVTLVFNTLTGVQNAALAGFEAFRKTATVNLVRGLVALPAMVVTTYLLGLTGAVMGLGLAAAAAFSIGRMTMHHEGRSHGVVMQRTGTWGERSVIWGFSLPIFVSGSILISGEWFCEALLVRQPGGYVQMGLYTAAFQWTNAIEFLQNTLGSPAVSLMSNLYWTGDLSRFRKLCLANIGFLVLASGAIAGVLALGAPWIMRAYGQDFSQGVTILRLICAMAAVRAVSRATSNVLFSVNHVRVEWACSMVRIGVQLLLWFALRSHGAAGLAIAMLGAYTAQVVLQSTWVLVLLRNPSPGLRQARP